ncbi:MAG: o-succinylbenzoate synthase [Candidatus Bipolaricaulota bacterium]
MVDESGYIKKVRLVEVEVPYNVPFQISGGVSYARKSIIIELHGEDGVGYGESAPFEAPFYSPETISTVKAVLTECLIPRIVGESFDSIEEFNERINENVRGNEFAKAGIETAYWDFIAKKNELPLQSLIREKLVDLHTPGKFLQTHTRVPCGASVGIPEDESLSTLVEWVNDLVNRGYNRIKIKIRPGWDLKAVKAVRKAIGDDFPFWVDANSSFTYPDHLQLFKEMDKYNCLFIEQPLEHNDILDHEKLARRIDTPICFDESLTSLRVAKQVVEREVSRIWNIKIQRVGGLLEAIRIYDFAVRNRVKLWGGYMPETGIGARYILGLGCFNGFTYSTDVNPSVRWFKPDQDLIEVEMDDEGQIYVGDEAGIGQINERGYGENGKVFYESPAK